jgi:hypothetical protein
MAGITMSPQLRESPETANVQGCGDSWEGAEAGAAEELVRGCFSECPWAWDFTAKAARTAQQADAQINQSRRLIGFSKEAVLS